MVEELNLQDLGYHCDVKRYGYSLLVDISFPVDGFYVWDTSTISRYF